jgi:hypothetical protein
MASLKSQFGCQFLVHTLCCVSFSYHYFTFTFCRAATEVATTMGTAEEEAIIIVVVVV